jgi:ubiquinone biosynthesis protein
MVIKPFKRIITMRIIKILNVILKYNLFIVFFKKENFFFKIINFFDKKNQTNECRIRKSLEELGPVFIKLGQIISTRTELISKNMENELKNLQTHNLSINFKYLSSFIDKSKITKINENPIAIGSVAQLHTAILPDNTKIIIKIIKPNIKYIIESDIKILKFLSRILYTFFNRFRRLKPLDVVLELEKNLIDEINLHNEEKNILNIKKISKSLYNIYIPDIFTEFTTNNILVIEYLDGINLTNIDKFFMKNIKGELIIKYLFESFYTQVFKYGFFHADLHPGNIMISINNKSNPIIIFIDFGIFSKININERKYLYSNLLAFSKRDYKTVALLHYRAKTISSKYNLKHIENEIRKIFDKIFNKNLNNINIREIIPLLLNLTKKFDFKIQPKLILFQKTLLSIESLSRKVSPEINLWKLTRLSIEKIIIRNIVLNFLKNHKLDKNTKDLYFKNKNNYLKIIFITLSLYSFCVINLVVYLNV